MLQTIWWHYFSVHISLLFEIVHSVLLLMLHLKNILLVNPESCWGSWIQRAKWSTPSAWAMKTELKNSVRLSVAFCLTYFCALQVVARILAAPRWSLLSMGLVLIDLTHQSHTLEALKASKAFNLLAIRLLKKGYKINSKTIHKSNPKWLNAGLALYREIGPSHIITIPYFIF